MNPIEINLPIENNRNHNFVYIPVLQHISLIIKETIKYKQKLQPNVQTIQNLLPQTVPNADD